MLLFWSSSLLAESVCLFFCLVGFFVRVLIPFICSFDGLPARKLGTKSPITSPTVGRRVTGSGQTSTKGTSELSQLGRDRDLQKNLLRTHWNLVWLCIQVGSDEFLVVSGKTPTPAGSFSLANDQRF